MRRSRLGSRCACCWTAACQIPRRRSHTSGSYQSADIHMERVGYSDQVLSGEISGLRLAQLHPLDLADVDAGRLRKLCLRQPLRPSGPLQFADEAIVAIQAIVGQRADGAVTICPPAVCVFFPHRGPPLELDFRCVVEHFVFLILGADRLPDDSGCFFPGNPLYKRVAVKIAVFHKCFSGGLFQSLNQFVFLHCSYPPLFQITVRLGNHSHADLLRGAVEVYEAEDVDQLAGVLYGVDAVDLEVNSLVPHLNVCLAGVAGVLSHPLQCGDGFSLEIFGPCDLLLSTLHNSFLLGLPLSLCF
nr:MAG TPA: hypothetical protein [Caudoviricetes sp.]